MIVDFFDLATEFLGIWGCVIYSSKGLDISFPTIYYMPRETKNNSIKTKQNKSNVLKKN
jgi:hypothetical protein